MKKHNNVIRVSIKYSVMFFMGFLFVLLIMFILVINAHIVGIKLESIKPLIFILVTMISCLIIGTIFAFFTVKKASNNMKQLKDTLNMVAAGNFDVEIPENQKMDEFDLIPTFNKMLHELQKNEMLKKDFISNYSHEFKTPIVSIKGYAEFLYETPELKEEERNKYLSIIIDESRRLANLSNEIMELQRLENTEIITDVETFYVDSQIKECVLLLDNQFKEKAIEVSVNLDRIKYSANQDMLKAVWINLLTNAIKYSNYQGKIEISSYLDDECATISIRDYGIGISEENLPYIFEKFYQADKSHRGLGIGLGLSITKRIIELSKGKIEVKSVCGKGTIFNIILPLSSV